MSDDRERRFAISDVVDFCRRGDTRGLCFGGWPDNILAIYLRFHQQNGNLCLVEEDEVLVGLGVGYKCDESDLDRHWNPGSQESDAIYLSDIICTTRRAMGACVDELTKRMPDYKSHKIFMLRHGKRKQLDEGFIDRWMQYCQA